MNQVLKILALSLTLISCRSVNKNLVKTSEKEKTDLTAINISSGTAVATTGSNGTYTTTREFQDDIDVPVAVITGSVSADCVNHGHIETADGSIDFKTDTVTGVTTATATTKSKKIPAKGKETTIGSINTVSTATTSSSSASVVIFSDNKEIGTVNNSIERKQNFMLFIIIGVAIGSLIMFIILWFLRKEKQKQPSG